MLTILMASPSVTAMMVIEGSVVWFGAILCHRVWLLVGSDLIVERGQGAVVVEHIDCYEREEGRANP